MSKSVVHTLYSVKKCLLESKTLPVLAEVPQCVTDPTSDECAAFTAEYCLDHPGETVCALFLPMFVRTVGQTAPLRLPTLGQAPQPTPFGQH